MTDQVILPQQPPQPSEMQSKCTQHITYPKEFIYIYNQDDEPLLCFYCAKHKFKNMQSILHFREIQEASMETIWPYFPPLQNENLWMQLSQLEGRINEIESLQSQFEGFCCQLKEEITSALESSKSRMNSSIQMLRELRQAAIDNYNEIASKQELIKLFQEDHNGITKRLAEIIREKQENVVKNTRIITQAMQNFQTVFENVSLKKPQQIKEQLIKMARSVEFFSGLDLDVYNEFINKQKMELTINNQNNYQNTMIDCTNNILSNTHLNGQKEGKYDEDEGNKGEEDELSSQNYNLKECQENITQLDEIVQKYLNEQEDDQEIDGSAKRVEEEKYLIDNSGKINRQFDSIDYSFHNISQQIREHCSKQAGLNSSSKSISNTDILMKLIQNKTNFCSKQFIQIVEKCLEKVAFYINKQDFQIEKAFNEQKRQVFQSLDIDQIEQIRLLAKQIQETQRLYKESGLVKKAELDQFLHMYEREDDEYDSTVDVKSRKCYQNINDSRDVTEVMLIDKINRIPQNVENCDIDDEILDDEEQLHIKGKNNHVRAVVASSLNEINQQIQSKSSFVFSQLKDSTVSQKQHNELALLLKQFPVFELLNFPLRKQLLNSCWFSKSSFKASHNQTIKRTEQGFIQIIAEGSPDYKLSYSSFKLDFKKKYIFRIILRSGPSSADTFMVFGLTDETIKDQSTLFSQGMSYCERRNEFGLNKIIKGGNLHGGSKRNLYREFEVRIHLNDRIIKVSDYPDYRNVCELDDKNKIKGQREYRFATELSYSNDSFTFTSIQEVDTFDDNM